MAKAKPAIETKVYSDGITAMGVAPLPNLSPADNGAEVVLHIADIDDTSAAVLATHIMPTPPNTLDAARALPLLIGQEQHFAFLPHLPIQAFRDTDGANRLVVQLENGTYAKA
jgi:hypothetical protein